MDKIQEILNKNKKILTWCLSAFLFILVLDLSGLDAIFHKGLCLIFSIFNRNVVCPDYYDIPFWSLFEVVGVFATVGVAIFFGLAGIKQANKQEKSAQELQMDQDLPIIFLNPGSRLHQSGAVSLHLMNVGKGMAKDVYVYIDDVLIDGNFSMHTKVPTDSTKLDVKVIDTEALPDVKTALSQKVSQVGREEIMMKITYKDIHNREFVTNGITFKKNNMGEFDHDRGKWAFRREEF